jgi:hypothetical protein
MKIQTYRRKDKAAYATLQDFLDDVAGDGELESPEVFELFSYETAQIERLTFLATRKNRFQDQFNFQIVTGEKIQNDTPVVLGTKSILGQPRDVRWRSANYFAPRMWDWRSVGEQAIEVWVRWDPAPTEPVTVLFNVWGD